MDEDAVLITLIFPEDRTDNEKVFDALMKLENLIRETLELYDLGYIDGHEFMMVYGHNDEITYFIYGPSADDIVKRVKPLVTGLPYLPGSFIVKQYSDEKDIAEYLAVN